VVVGRDHEKLRVVTIGGTPVGKTFIVNKFIHDRYGPSEKRTIGAIHNSWRDHDHGREVEIQIWDTCGQE
jgi:GTPase SAR1 family protein